MRKNEEKYFLIFVFVNFLMAVSGCGTEKKQFGVSSHCGDDISSPAYYIPFEPVSTSDGISPWINRGEIDIGLAARIGQKGNHSPSITPCGLRGWALDARFMQAKSCENAPQFGGLDQQTRLCQTLNSMRSFTLTCWIRTETLQEQGRIIKTPAFQINYRGDFLETAFGKPKEWIKSDLQKRSFCSVGRWIFIAVTCQILDESRAQLSFCHGLEQSPVKLDSQQIIDLAGLIPKEDDGFLVIGNSESDGNRPFIGCIDEVRLWLEPHSTRGALSLDQLECIRQNDVKSSMAGS